MAERIDTFVRHGADTVYVYDEPFFYDGRTLFFGVPHTADCEKLFFDSDIVSPYLCFCRSSKICPLRLCCGRRQISALPFRRLCSRRQSVDRQYCPPVGSSLSRKGNPPFEFAGLYRIQSVGPDRTARCGCRGRARTLFAQKELLLDSKRTCLEAL